MLSRSKFPKHRNVMLINDTPVKAEVTMREKFCSASNMNLLTSLRTGKVTNFTKVSVGSFKGILSTDIFTTYLDYSPFAEGNFDFKNDFKKRKDLQVVKYDEESTCLLSKDFELNLEEDILASQYHKLEHQNDVYVSDRLWKEFQALLQEIEIVQPKLIIPTGKWGLFLLTGCTSLTTNMGNYKDRKPLGGLNKFRSSILQIHPCFNLTGSIVLPMIHTIHAMGMPDKISVMELDLQKAIWMYHIIVKEGIQYFTQPEKEYILGTTKEIAINYLNSLLSRLEVGKRKVSIDIETFFHSVIDCIGITDSIDHGLCIPFCTKTNNNYFSLEDEVDIMVKLREVMLHPNTLHIGQNYSFDCQYFYKLWGIKVRASDDTMIHQHTLYNYMPKNLAFLASLYCVYYSYWKDDITAIAENPETRWIYNIKDVMYTLEVLEAQYSILEKEDEKLQRLYHSQINRLSPCAVKTMNKGVRIDRKKKEELYVFFSQLMVEVKEKINTSLGFEFNINSFQQKQKVFKDFLGMTLKVKRGKGTETCDAAAMLDYIDEYPLYRPFLVLLLEYASLKVFTTNFLGMKLDEDGRARTQYNVAGTNTGRLASRKNVWGGGGNFQNIPERGKINLIYALQTLEESDTEGTNEDILQELSIEGSIQLPNVKKIFLPDIGKEICDADYSGADIMVVAADSECKWLLDFFGKPQEKKVYAHIASEFYQRDISDKGSEYKTLKAVFHGSNYGLGLDKLAVMAGIPYYLAKELQEFYFMLNPEIKKWQSQINKDITSKGYITNIFGRRGWFLNKNDATLLNKALAFKPQSTIADLVNTAWINIDEKYPEVDILLQVHDSLVTQYDIDKAEFYRKAIVEAMQIELPFKCPITIPADIKVSRVSYGDCKKVSKLKEVQE